MIDFERSNCLRHLHEENVHKEFYTNDMKMDSYIFGLYLERLVSQFSNDIEDLDSLQKLIDVNFFKSTLIYFAF